MLTCLLSTTPFSFSEIADLINKGHGTSYTRCAISGRASRIRNNALPQLPPEILAQRKLDRRNRTNARKKNESFAKKKAEPKARPPHPTRSEQQQKATRAFLSSSGMSKTSAGYRKNFPKCNVSRDDLRNMLAEAVRNTAAMDV
jgi:hypothetical protein